MRRSTFVLVGAAVAAVLLGVPRGWAPASAETGPQSEMAVIVMDSSAARQMEDAVPLTLSFIGLTATLQRDTDIVFVDTQQAGEPVGPFRVSDVDFSSRQSEIAARMREDGSVMPQSIPEALDEARSLLARYEAPAGSTIYLALGSSVADREYDALSYTAAPLMARIAERNWTIHGLRLRDGDQGAEQFLSGVSGATGGRVFSLASGSDLKRLADYLSSGASGDDLTEIGARTSDESETFSARLNITPGTEESTLFFFNGGGAESFRLTNPDGLEVSSGGPASHHLVIETENLVIWRLMNPEPGEWRVDAAGVDGGVSVWGRSSSRYDLVLRMLSPLPVGRSSGIMGYAADGGRTVVLEGARMFAEITGPDSSVRVYELLDDGTHGDSEAGDGYYTFNLPPIESEGSYDVKLELSWNEFGHKITSNSAFDALVFPSFHFEAASVSDLEVGETTRVGTVSVHRDGGPYTVDPGAITVAIVSPTGERGKVDLVPRRLYGDGPASQYDALFTPEEGGAHTLQFVLQLEYGGRTYVDTSSLALSAKGALPAIPAPSAPMAAEPPEVSSIPEPVGEPAVPVVSGIPMNQDSQTQFPWLAAALGSLAVVIAGVVAAFFMTRPSPFGYLYTDEDDEVVDFSKVKRRPMLQFFYKSLIRGSELNVPGLEGLVFHFMRDRVNVRSFDERPSVRVNNQPLIDSATINDKAWIGAGGRLYTFLSAPKPATGFAEGD